MIVKTESNSQLNVFRVPFVSVINMEQETVVLASGRLELMIVPSRQKKL